MLNAAGQTLRGHITRRTFARLMALGGISVVAAFAGCGGLTACMRGNDASPGGEGLRSTTIFAFDTVCTINAQCDAGTLDEAAALCAHYEQIFSRTRDDSDISRINAAGGVPVEVAPETASLITSALEYSRQTDGLFDITVGAASSLWDFVEGVVPDAAALDEAVRHIGYRTVQVDARTVVIQDPEAKLDLGGIAKGYVADALCAFLEERGCTSGFINLGGNVKTIGARPDGAPWRVGVQDPDAPRETVLAAVRSTGGSVVTSGLYERQFERDGRRYGHILDPRTGYPAESDLSSVTVLSRDSIEGDALSTALFLMGCEKARAFANGREGMEALFVTAAGEVVRSDGCEVELA